MPACAPTTPSALSTRSIAKGRTNPRAPWARRSRRRSPRTPEERQRLAEELAKQAKAPRTTKSGGAPASPPPDAKELEEQLRALANDDAPSDEAAREAAIDGASQGASETEAAIDGQRGNGSGNGSAANGDGAGAGGSHDFGTGLHRGRTDPVAGDTLKSRAHAAMSAGNAMPGSVTTFAPGRAGDVATALATGDSASRRAEPARRRREERRTRGIPRARQTVFQPEGDDAMTSDDFDARLHAAAESVKRLRDAIAKVVVGQHTVVDQVMWALVAGGHVLLEGAPGLGKTLLVRTLSECLDLHFSRIQFTPDLMPSDVVGTNVLVMDATARAAHGTFALSKGPIFGQIVLADEINRATPKTQSALLEAMAEHAVTIAGTRHALDEPFFVLATENPIEMEGTYPLPEAQLDRFLLKIVVPNPSEDDLCEVLARTTGRAPEAPGRVMGRAERDGAARDVPRRGHRGARGAVRSAAGARERSEREGGTRAGEARAAVRRRSPRRAVAGARRQGGRALRRAPARVVRRHCEGREARAAPSTHSLVRR